MHIHVTAGPVASLIAGVLPSVIFLMPSLLNDIRAIYLILIGLMGLF